MRGRRRNSARTPFPSVALVLPDSTRFRGSTPDKCRTHLRTSAVIEGPATVRRFVRIFRAACTQIAGGMLGTSTLTLLVLPPRRKEGRARPRAHRFRLRQFWETEKWKLAAINAETLRVTATRGSRSFCALARITKLSTMARNAVVATLN